MSDAPLTDAQRRNADRLGWALGAGVLALVVLFVILFSRNGLPKDPEEFQRLERLRSAANGDASP